MKSISFSSYKHVMNSVQCTLTNDEKSPCFSRPDLLRTLEKTIVFDQNKTIRSITAYHKTNSDLPYVGKVEFRDVENKVYDAFDSAGSPMNSKIQLKSD